ncbi:MAG TPA: hypothetical protein VH814_18265 [Steroidobacteraceae bacterium]
MIGGLVLICGLVAVCLSLVWFIRSRVAEQYVVHIADVPMVFQQLREHGSDGSFAAFMFSDHGRPGEKNQVDLQFSIENGTAGLDWVLLAPINVRDEQRAFDFLKARHAKPRRLAKNDVTYRRVEEGDLVQLCQHIMSGLYGVKADDPIDLVPEGFVWKP